MRDIVVLFKGVEERQLADPGDQLQKVLAFKRQLETEQAILFSNFDSEKDCEHTSSVVTFNDGRETLRMAATTKGNLL